MGVAVHPARELEQYSERQRNALQYLDVGNVIKTMVDYVEEINAQATAQIHYAATALSNHSKTVLDGMLPQIQTAAKYYGL